MHKERKRENREKILNGQKKEKEKKKVGKKH